MPHVQFLLFGGPDSYEALNGAVTKYVRNCKSSVSNFTYEEIRPATSNAASETMQNDVKGIKAYVGNKLVALSEKLHNLSFILKKKKWRRKRCSKMFAVITGGQATLPINRKTIFLRNYVLPFDTG